MALGRARLEQPSRYLVDERPLAEDEVEDEIVRLQRAILAAREEMRVLREKLHGTMAREVAEFIDAHSLMLADRELTTGVYDLIRKGRYRASAALKMQRDNLVAMFEAMDDPYLRSRKEDVEHVIARVQAGLVRESSREERKLASRMGEILVSDTVSPSELVPLAEHGVSMIHAMGVWLDRGTDRTRVLRENCARARAQCLQDPPNTSCARIWRRSCACWRRDTPARTGHADSDTGHDQRWRERPRQGALGSGAGHDSGVVHAIVGAVTPVWAPSGESAQSAASRS